MEVEGQNLQQTFLMPLKPHHKNLHTLNFSLILQRVQPLICLQSRQTKVSLFSGTSATSSCIHTTVAMSRPTCLRRCDGTSLWRGRSRNDNSEKDNLKQLHNSFQRRKVEKK
jgi:hypothetical protein